MAGIALGPERKRILVMCGDDAAAVTAANVYAKRLRNHELVFLEEKTVSLHRIAAFSRRRLRSKGIASLLASFAYYGVRFTRSSRPAHKGYHPVRTVTNFNTDPMVRSIIREFKPDAVLICFCSVLQPGLLELLPEASYNIHPGVNPRYRGFGNIWAVHENAFNCLGYTIHRLDPGTDTGERVAVVTLSGQDLPRVDLIDIDVPVSLRAAKHLAGLLLGTEEASIPEQVTTLPSRLYGVPTLGVFLGAERNYKAALERAPRHIVVTGASSGIGKALAEGYAAPGVLLSLWGRNSDRLEDTARRCREKGAEASVICQDVRDLEGSREALAELHQKSAVDLAILGAGVSSGTGADGAPERPEQACRTMHVNATASVNMAGKLFELMGERGTGHVVCLSSIAALYPLPDSPSYSAAKNAFACYARAMRPLVSPVRVSVVYPGYVDTPMSRRLKGPQPLRWSVDKAAAHIRNRLEKGSDSIMFPIPLACGTLLLRLLPPRLARFFLKRFAFSIEPDGEARPDPQNNEETRD